MSRIAEWTKRHQVAAFYGATFAMMLGSILGLILFQGSRPLNQVVQLYLSRLAVFGPALAGMLVTRLSGSRHREPGHWTRWLAFLLVWILAWMIAAVYFQLTTPSDNLPAVVLILGPMAMLPAYVISGAFSRTVSIKQYLSTLVRPRGSFVWYLIALFAFPVIHLLGNAITRTLDGGSSAVDGVVGHDLIFLSAITFLNVLFYTGGINEESGWRGFALPRLQARYSPLMASLVIWFFHAIWELPGDLTSASAAWHATSRLVIMPCWTILFAWVYNRTKGSILAPALFHASMNAMNPLMGVLPVTDAVMILLFALAAFAIVCDRMWKRLPAQ
jgi:membrane protease YdiL (CAAX protease family)